MDLFWIITRPSWLNVLSGVSLSRQEGMKLIMIDKVDLVKRILLELHRSLKECEDEGKKNLVFKRFDPFEFVKTTTNAANSPKSVSELQEERSLT
jgi:hypothetical protein